MTDLMTVYVVDDDAGMRKSLCRLLDSEEISCEVFSSADEFLTKVDNLKAGCLILDIKMPGMSGIELQKELVRREIILPIIIVSAHASVAIAVGTMKLGAFDVIEKPYSADFLLQRVREALVKGRHLRAQHLWKESVKAYIKLLTPREKEILSLVASGQPSKMIADKLSLSVSTVDNHRARIMKKLGAGTTADLTRLVLMADPDLIAQ